MSIFATQQRRETAFFLSRKGHLFFSWCCGFFMIGYVVFLAVSFLFAFLCLTVLWRCNDKNRPWNDKNPIILDCESTKNWRGIDGDLTPYVKSQSNHGQITVKKVFPRYFRQLWDYSGLFSANYGWVSTNLTRKFQDICKNFRKCLANTCKCLGNASQTRANVSETRANVSEMSRKIPLNSF